MAATQFDLIRHALTVWNEEKRIQGQEDSPLSVQGRVMACNWGKQLAHLKWDRILMSDLNRVRQTADLINTPLQLSIHCDKRLREQNWGDWSGRRLPSLLRNQQQQVREQEKAGWNFRPPAGESRLEVLARSQHALLDAHQRWPGERILVICHEGVIKCLLYHLYARSFLPQEPPLIKSYQLHRIEADQGKISMVSINHLPLAPAR